MSKDEGRRGKAGLGLEIAHKTGINYALMKLHKQQGRGSHNLEEGET